MCDKNFLISKKRKNHVLNEQAREMAIRVLQICVEEKKNKFTYNINKALARAAYYTGLSKNALLYIQKEAKEGRLRSPPSRKGLKCNRKNSLKVDDFNRSMIHRCIEELYLTRKCIPTVAKLLDTIKQKIDFPWGPTSLRKLLKEMGYQWKHCNKKQRILVEKPKVVSARSNYLRTIQGCRENERNIIFIGEICIYDNLTFKRRSQTDAISDCTNSLTIIHAGSRNGFLDCAKLLIDPGGLDAYHNQLYGINYDKWATDLLIPNLPSNSIIIADNTLFNSVGNSKLPKRNSTKAVMLDWLSKNNINASDSMLNEDLYSLIELYKPAEQIFKIDEVIRDNGHELLRLPPYMCDLNPIELAWGKIKQIMMAYNVNSELPMSQLKGVLEMAIEQITEEDWCGFVDHVMILEDHYSKKDEDMKNVLDKLKIKLHDGEDTDSDTSISENEFEDK